MKSTWSTRTYRVIAVLCCALLAACGGAAAPLATNASAGTAQPARPAVPDSAAPRPLPTNTPTAMPAVGTDAGQDVCATGSGGSLEQPAREPWETEQRVQASYDADSNTITVQKGPPATLGSVAEALGENDALREVAAGEWLLSANLRVEPGAALRIVAPEVRRLKLRSDADGFVWVKTFGGQLEFADTCVTSWDMAQDTYDLDYEDGRSFVLARDGGRLDIRGSSLSYLGYHANESYGVAWRLEGTSGEIVDSQFGYNFYGMYSFEASDLVIRGNEVHHSVRYGIDPHTRSNRLLIENNRSHHNGKHGIILARECSDGVIRNNETYDNAMHGIVIFERSNNNVVEGNTSYGNGYQGININDAKQNTIRDNTVYDNAEGGIGLQQTASENRVVGNTVRANLMDGIAAYSDATDNLLLDNTVHDNARYGIYIKSEGNTIGAGNQIFGNRVGVYLNVQQAQDVSQQANRIYDNRDADVRTGRQ